MFMICSMVQWEMISFSFVSQIMQEFALLTSFWSSPSSMFLFVPFFLSSVSFTEVRCLWYSVVGAFDTEVRCLSEPVYRGQGSVFHYVTLGPLFHVATSSFWHFFVNRLKTCQWETRLSSCWALVHNYISHTYKVTSIQLSAYNWIQNLNDCQLIFNQMSNRHSLVLI